MGQCGCSDGIDPGKAFRITDDVLLNVSEYRGCRDCEAAPAIDLTLITRFEADEYGIEYTDLPLAKARSHGWTSILSAGFIGYRELVKAASNIDKRQSFDLAEFESVEELMKAIGEELLDEAMEQRKNDWAK